MSNLIDFIRNHPFLRLLLPLILGIYFAFVIRNEILHKNIILSISFLFAIISIIVHSKYLHYRYRWIFGFLINISIFSIGFCSYEYETEISELNEYKNEIINIGSISSEVKESKNSYSTNIQIHTSKIDGIYKDNFVNAKLVFEKDSLVLSLLPGDDIIFNPEGLLSGTLDFATDKYSSISEVELFILPALFYNDFRSVINYTGVTHSHLSYPTTFLKETFFSYLEMTGHYASLNLKRFGFYGSGGGSAESRIYPAEPKSCGDIFSFADSAIEGVRIFMAKMNMEMAHREREFIIKNIGVDESRVQIMEIVDADGYGNSIHVYVKCGGVNVILSKDMELYNSAGDFVFEESRYYAALTGLLKDVERLVKVKTLPDYLMDEVLPYLFLSGSEVPEVLKNSESYRICSEFL